MNALLAILWVASGEFSFSQFARWSTANGKGDNDDCRVLFVLAGPILMIPALAQLIEEARGRPLNAARDSEISNLRKDAN